MNIPHAFYTLCFYFHGSRFVYKIYGGYWSTKRISVSVQEKSVNADPGCRTVSGAHDLGPANTKIAIRIPPPVAWKLPQQKRPWQKSSLPIPNTCCISALMKQTPCSCHSVLVSQCYTRRAQRSSSHTVRSSAETVCCLFLFQVFVLRPSQMLRNLLQFFHFFSQLRTVGT
jgi:hypothetical protein